MSNFPDYAGPLTETVLLGNLAVWSGEKVEWDAANMKSKNVEGLEPIIKPNYRKGYTLGVTRERAAVYGTLQGVALEEPPGASPCPPNRHRPKIRDGTCAPDC